jgi:hypothetical protein
MTKDVASNQRMYRTCRMFPPPGQSVARHAGIAASPARRDPHVEDEGRVTIDRDRQVSVVSRMREI